MFDSFGFAAGRPGLCLILSKVLTGSIKQCGRDFVNIHNCHWDGAGHENGC